MPDPIVVTITAVPDPNTQDTLIVSVDFNTVFLSVEDLDEVQWVCPFGTFEVNFAPAANPFDPNASTGGQYVSSPQGSAISGPLFDFSWDDESFQTFKYSILVKSPDGTRSGAVDPRVKGRKKRVYYGTKDGNQ